MRRIDTMIVVAHDDDEALMCGGYISKHSPRSSILVVSAIACTDEQKRAAILNAKRFGYSYLPLRLTQWNVQLHDLARRFSEIIAEYSPDTIVTHPAFDTHQEHRLVNSAIEIASRAIDMRGVGSNYVYNILYGYGTGAYENSDIWKKPNVFLRLSEEDVSNKAAMLAAYGKEMRGTRSGCCAVTDCMFWGKLINSEFAEAYLTKRILLNG